MLSSTIGVLPEPVNPRTRTDATRDNVIVLAVLSPEFDRMYADVGRPSNPSERLLKASLLLLAA
jgi:hypothetical protein